jgi:hypothetical protein
MAVWDELKVVLARLRDQQPGPLMQSPMPEADEGRQPPFVIGLEPWAAAVAEELHRQFGADVELTVGALPYPPGRPPPPRPPPARPRTCSTRTRSRPSWPAPPWSAPGTPCGTACCCGT